MKKLLSCILAFAVIVLSVPLTTRDSYAEDKVTLNVYNWGQYLADGTDGYIDVIAEFEKKYPNIKVNYMTYDNNETMYTKLQTDPHAFDLIVPSDYMIEKLIEEDMLEEIDFSNIPNYAYVNDTLKNLPFDPENKYSVPYTWGLVCIIYNSKYVNEEDIGSWDLLWNPTYAGKILMFDNPRDAFGIAEYLLGFDPNTEDPEELEAAAEKLKEQKNLVQAYVMDQIFDKMEREEAWIAPYYAGDYLLMVEENEDLEYFFPEEGFNLFVDSLCIPKGARNKEAAELFINFLCEPEICGQNMEYLVYCTPIEASKEFMDEELAYSEVLYPPDEVLEKASAFSALSTEGTRLMNELWLSVKTSDNVLVKYLIFTGAVLLAVIILWLVLAIRKKRRIARRCGGYEESK